MMHGVHAAAFHTAPVRFGRRGRPGTETRPDVSDIQSGALQSGRTHSDAGEMSDTQLNVMERARTRFNRLLVAATMLVGALMGTGHVMQARMQDEVNNLEAAFGRSMRAVENPDGSVSVVLAPFQIPADLVEHTAPASLRVRILKDGLGISSGSGVFIRTSDDQFYVLTNDHVVDALLDGEADSIRLHPYRQPDVVLDAEVVRLPDGRAAVDGRNDLALLRVSLPDYVPAHFIDASRIRNLERDPLEDNEPLFSVGNPGSAPDVIMPGLAFDHSFNDGVDDIEYLQACLPGSSGSPVFDLQGRLVGLNRSVSIPARGRCWGVPAGSLTAFLEDAGVQSSEKQESFLTQKRLQAF